MSDTRSLSNDEFAERMRQRRGEGAVCVACGQVFVFGGGKNGKCNKCLNTVKKKPKKKPISGEPPPFGAEANPPGPVAPSVSSVPASMPAVPPVESLEERLKKLCVDMERALTFRGDHLFVLPDHVASWDWSVTTDPEWVSIKMELLLANDRSGVLPRVNITGLWNIGNRDFRVDKVESKKE